MGFFDGAPLGAPAGLGFSTGLLDRAAHRREDADWLRAAREKPSTRFVALCRDTPVLAFTEGRSTRFSRMTVWNPWDRRSRRCSLASMAKRRALRSTSRRTGSKR